METTESGDVGQLRAALDSPDPSVRLQAVLDAGTSPNPDCVPVLIERCGVEDDFYVRDMLTWSLVRQPVSITMPRLLAEMTSPLDQARSQALHTLSKIGDPRGWTAITPDRLRDPHDQVARSAWRAAVVLVPPDQRLALARELSSQIGRGDREVQLSLSRALAVLGPAAASVVRAAAVHPDPVVRTHALATERLMLDPEESFDAAMFEANRIVALGRPAGSGE